MSFFDEVESTVANTRLLQALEDDAPVVLKLVPFEELTEFEIEYRKKILEPGGFRTLFKDKSVRYYQLKRFLKDKGELGWVQLLEDMDQFKNGYLTQRRARALEIVAKCASDSRVVSLESTPNQVNKTIIKTVIRTQKSDKRRMAGT